ncbi:Lrp/AsnC family transcriptional regulator [Halobaculum sp. EA56]|uniref:Lrp/AsnC family transcriptional regulator n=1 Tax=Halobaculum sp. EA56 TaxID=3421648 RepID=UPI003EBD04A3
MELDETNRAILYLLQRDARQLTMSEMAEKIGVSTSTVRNRIKQMEADGIIRGYHPIVDYDKAGLQLHMVFICSAPSHEREALAHKAREVSGVLSIAEVIDGDDNLQIEAVGVDTDDIARISDELEALGLDVKDSKILKSYYTQPFDHFGRDLVTEEGDPDD